MVLKLKIHTIFEFDNDQKLKKKFSRNRLIFLKKKWILTDVKVFSFSNGILEKKNLISLKLCPCMI